MYTSGGCTCLSPCSALIAAFARPVADRPPPSPSPSRSLSVSSVSSVSSASSGSSSARSADSDDMYADLASPVSSASSRSPTPSHPSKERGAARDRAPHARDKTRGECGGERGALTLGGGLSCLTSCPVLSRETPEEGGALQRRAQEDGAPWRLAQGRKPRAQVGSRQQGRPPSTPSAGGHGTAGEPRRFGFPQRHQAHPPQQGECGS